MGLISVAHFVNVFCNGRFRAWRLPVTVARALVIMVGISDVKKALPGGFSREISLPESFWNLFFGYLF